MKSDFLIAVTQLAAERNLPRDMVISAVEAALVSAYKKDANGTQNIRVRLDPNTGDVSIYQVKTVVEEVADEANELTVQEARNLRRNGNPPQVGEEILIEMKPQVAGRIAAQTAKQVVIQRLREAERELIFNEFSEKQGEVFSVTVQRGDARYGGAVTVDLNGRAEAVLPQEEQSPFDRYRPGTRMKMMIKEVRRSPRGPEIVVTRAHPDLLKRLFEMEVPEIYNGIVEIRGIAREPGSRSKVAVMAKQEGVDPVGACVGLRGIRIQNIVNELSGEKIDVIQWSKDPRTFIGHALSPAQPLRVELDEAGQVAMVVVPDRQLSLAIGREGQNARLAAKLTGWKTDIKSSTEVEIERMKQVIEVKVAEQEAAKAAAAAVPAPAAQAPAAPAEPKAPLAPEPSVARPAAQAPARRQPAETTAERAAASGLSIEEQLALETFAEATRQAPTEAAVDEDTEELVIDEEDIWKVPEPIGGGPQIRFAEDILGGRGERRG
ncbi:MAG: transcription termination/antitermination protein NusA, partial [SAR202 cluster bacterium]|nr:transcription termination/antitermination protein NusA [SAR202 cluster bacterium]